MTPVLSLGVAGRDGIPRGAGPMLSVGLGSTYVEETAVAEVVLVAAEVVWPFVGV
jgi:hypothetical protein